MNCKTIHERLSAYLDGELPQADATRVEQHLSECARCAAELAELRAVGSVLSEMEGAAVPAAFAARISEAVRLGRAAEVHREPIRLFGLARARVLVRIAAGLIAVAGLLVGTSMAGSAFSAFAEREPASRDQAPAVAEAPEPGEFEVQMASMSVAPPGSMAEAYLRFVKTEVAGGQER